MTSLQDQVKDICRLADAVVKSPSTPVVTTAGNIGVGAAIAGFAAGGRMLFAPLLGPVVGGIVVAILKAINATDKKKKEQQEKERMLREVIRKQQVVIRKLEQEVEMSSQQNKKNRQEIENLKEMLRMLNETEEHLRAA